MRAFCLHIRFLCWLLLALTSKITSKTLVGYADDRPRGVISAKSFLSLFSKPVRCRASVSSHIQTTVLNKPRPPRLVILGAPAAGKGTQAEKMRSSLGIVHLSTGEILRKAVADRTPLGIRIKENIDMGRLVPDDAIIGIVHERLHQPDCIERGWLLDGFPRTSAQAVALKQMNLVPDCFILLDIPEGKLAERISGRRMDPVTGNIYHLKKNPPPNDPEILRRLVQRVDDTEEKLKGRVEEYQSNIEAIKKHFADRLLVFDGASPIDQLSQNIFKEVTKVCSIVK